MTETTSRIWNDVLATRELTNDQRQKAAKIRDWQAERDQISCDVIDGTITSQDEQESREAKLGPIPAKVICAGEPVKEIFCVGPTRFVFDHNVARGYRFHVAEGEAAA